MGLGIVQCVQPLTFQQQIALALGCAERIGLLQVDVPATGLSMVDFLMRHGPAQASALGPAGR